VQAQTNKITSASGTVMPRFAVDGLHPERLVAPQTAEEAGALLKEANAQSWGVVPFGSGSKQHIGNPLKKFNVALSLEHFNQILEFEPQDLVVKVQAGCPLATLQVRLAQEGLCLPVDPPWQDRATLGGIVSSHDSGPLRFSHGTIRDYLIGISLIQPDGAWTKFGSRVVKNVTGYDMCKLYTGAFGTLGVLLDFYFKLKPLPPSENRRGEIQRADRDNTGAGQASQLTALASGCSRTAESLRAGILESFPKFDARRIRMGGCASLWRCRELCAMAGGTVGEALGRTDCARCDCW
jgi:FAD/FMN-containing dehydrogenase